VLDCHVTGETCAQCALTTRGSWRIFGRPSSKGPKPLFAVIDANKIKSSCSDYEELARSTPRSCHSRALQAQTVCMWVHPPFLWHDGRDVLHDVAETDIRRNELCGKVYCDGQLHQLIFEFLFTPSFVAKRFLLGAERLNLRAMRCWWWWLLLLLSKVV